MKNFKIMISLFSMLMLFTLQTNAIPDPVQSFENVIASDEGVRQSPEVTAADLLFTYKLSEMSKKETADAWLSIAVKEIKGKISKLKVHDTGSLMASVQGSIQELSGGDAYKATLLYNYYGIFPDMGVGKGIKKGDGNISKLLGFKRKAKNWTREVAAQRYRFGDVMQTAFAEDAITKIKDSIQVKHEFKA